MKKTGILLLALSTGVFVFAQYGSGWRGWGGGGDHGIVLTEGNQVEVDADKVRTAREIAAHSTDTPNWTNMAGFEKDVFTFARVLYRRAPNGSGISRSASPWGWITDFPDSDLNLSYRLQQVTSIKVDPDGRVLRLPDPDLVNFPWIYIVEPGGWEIKEEEIVPLRKYLLNGGVLMADDFWGELQWQNFESVMKRVIPGGKFVELPMEHALFHCIFDIKVPKNKLQTPNIMRGVESLNPNSRWYGVTWETHDGEECIDMHVRAMFDDKERVMVIAMHNCDNGDGWEREGQDDGFFHEFSEKRAYPLGINTIFYLMTH